MTAFIETALYVSVTALFVLLFKQLFKNKLSARWQVLIWLILAVRMIVPSLPQSRFSVFNAFDLPKEQKEVQTAFSENEQETDFNTVLPATPETEAIKENPSETVNFTLPTEETAPAPAVTPKSGTSRLLSADFIVPFIIRCGAAVLLLYFVLVYIINLAKIKKQGKKAEADSLQLLHDCKNTVGVKRKVSLVYYGKSPMLMGVIKPVIVLPEDFSDKEKQDIIIHELCHLKNGDIFALWLAVFLLCTSWYNPIIWLCFFTFRRDIEVYCDSRVLEYAVNKKEYAELLVRTALKRNSFIAGTTSLQNGEKEVERRIKYMAYFKKPKVIWIMIIAAIAVVIGVLCLTNAIVGKEEKNDKENNYISFLNGEASIAVGNTEQNLHEFLSSFGVNPGKDYAKYTYIDMNGDGIKELHLRTARSYHIFTLKNENVVLWYEGSTYDQPLNDGTILYQKSLGAPKRMVYCHKTLDSDGNIVSEVNFSEYTSDELPDGSNDRYFVEDKAVSWQEYRDFYYKVHDIREICWSVLNPQRYSFDNEESCEALIGAPYSFGILSDTFKLKGKEYYYTVFEMTKTNASEESTSASYYYNVFVFDDSGLVNVIEKETYEIKAFRSDINTVLEADVSFDGKNDILVGTTDLGCQEYSVYLKTEYGFEYCGTLEKMSDVHVNPKEKLLSGIYDNKDSKSFRFSDNKIEFLSYTDQAYTDQIRDNTLSLQTYAEVEVYSAHHNGNAVEELEKTDGIIESTPNFFLKQTVTDEGEAYYCEVYDNSGNILFSDTSARCPVFNHLDGSLYELQTGFGTFAWQSIYINVETGYISEPYDNPFYLTNGVIAYVNTAEALTDDGTTADDITLIRLYDLHEQKHLYAVDADFLKESSVTYQIEYEDNTHIAVTYYTENGQKENRKVIEVPPLSGTFSYNNQEQGEIIPSLPIDGEIKLLYASGAGAWGDYLHINPDGSFSGEYHDSDMGISDENNYPNGTVFIDRYSGRFGDFIKIDDYTYLLTVLEETHEFEPNAEWIEDGIRFVSTSPENPDIGTEYVLCLPGKPLSEIPKSVKEWELGNDSENTLTGYCLYPAQSPEIGYFQTA